MANSLAISALILALALPACFSPHYDCELKCSSEPGNGARCPSGLVCKSGFCRLQYGDTCPAIDSGTDAIHDRPLMDAGPDVKDTGTEVATDTPRDGTPDLPGDAPTEMPGGEPPSDASDTPPPSDASDTPPPSDASDTPPPSDASDAEARADGDGDGSVDHRVHCYNGKCITLSDASNAGQVLWLDPSNLPAAGLEVDVWPDLSGKGNDAMPVDPDTVLRSFGVGVSFADQMFAGLVVYDNPSIDLAADDFIVIVVAAVDGGTPLSSFFTKAFPPSSQVALEWIYPAGGNSLALVGKVDEVAIADPVALPFGQLTMMALRRTGDSVELRVNGTAVSPPVMVTPGESTSNNLDLYLGTLSEFGTGVLYLAGAAVIRGPTEPNDLSSLEGFFSALTTGP